MTRTRARRSLIAAWSGALRRGEWSFCAAALRRGLRLRLGLPVREPLFATLAVTWRCNFRCAMCDLPLRARRDPDTQTLLQRVRRLRARGALALGLTGGEPLLHPGLPAVAAAAKAQGMLVHLNTNGSALTERAAAWLGDGTLHSINISLDGARASTHDALRAAPGSFAQIERSLAELRRRRRGRDPRIALVMAVSRANLSEVRAFAARARELGADRYSFLPQHEFVVHASPLDAQEAAELRAQLADIAAEGDNSPAYLAGMVSFLAGGATPADCSAPRTHVAVDPAGVRYPCVPLMTLRRGGAPSAAGATGPRADDGAALPVAERDRAEVCSRCWWNCHRELDLALRLLR